LYGRAALILIVPVVAIQFAASAAFIQNHFSDVTRQMTRNVAIDVRHVAGLHAAAGDAARGLERARATAGPLGFTVEAAAEAPHSSVRPAFDLSGVTVIATLKDEVPGLESVDLSDGRRVMLVADTGSGRLAIGFDRRRVSASNPHQLILQTLTALLLVTFVTSIFLRNQLRPIRRLARAAEAFGKGQMLPFRPSGATEVRAAGQAFLDMRARIERAIEQRTLILSGVSHDLRTPLTRLRLGLTLLEEGPEVAAMIADVDEMRRLLDGFLEFARDDAETDAAAETDPRDLVAAIVADARRMGQKVDLIDGEAVAPVRLRPGAVRRGIENLIGNAVRYGSRAEVSVTSEAGHLVIAVEDDGPGIPAERREEAVRPFTRLDPARNQDRGGGVGLGLAITADIARSHGGELRLTEGRRLKGLRAELHLAQ
jgi:two-component system osmolarity sensor histidine kinase EnvZ